MMADVACSTPVQWRTAEHEVEHFEFNVRVHRDRVRIELFGELDVAATPTLCRRIDGLLARFEHLELDLTHLEFLGADGVALFAGAANALGATGTITLLSPSRGVRRVLDIVELPPCLRIETAGDRARSSESRTPNELASADA